MRHREGKAWTQISNNFARKRSSGKAERSGLRILRTKDWAGQDTGEPSLDLPSLGLFCRAVMAVNGGRHEGRRLLHGIPGAAGSPSPPICPGQHVATLCLETTEGPEGSWVTSSALYQTS